MADATESDARILEETAYAYQTYVGAVRAILTGGDLPPLPNPGGGGPLRLSPVDAIALTNGLMNNVAGVAKAVADRGQARAKELDKVTGKEQEEKEGEPPESGNGGTGGQDSGQDGGQQPPGGAADDSETRVRDPAEETLTPPSQGGGTGTEVTPPESGPGTGVRPPGGGSVTPPVTPVSGRTPPTGTRPPSITTRRTVRRYYRFRIRNRGNKPVSDIHFPTQNTSTGQTMVPTGWKSGNYSDGSGFGFQADGPDKVIPPGRSFGPFEFCIEGDSFTSEMSLSHPDGTLEPMPPGTVTSGGRPIPPNSEGNIPIPANRRTYVHEVDVHTGSGAERIDISVSNGSVSMPAGAEFTDGTNAQWQLSRNGRELTMYPVGPTGRIPGGRTVTITVESSSPNRNFNIRTN
ncbi:MAG: hypothetical protein IH872_05220 [Chloroflexi bacterium]|nr:hypothetical protein [Chloroflexota bacterium]